MKRLTMLATATTLLVTVAASAALADSQLARSLGVENQGYTTAELAQLKAATDDHDWSMVKFLKENHASNEIQQGATIDSTGTEQLVLSLNVAQGAHDLSDLAAIKHAKHDGDWAKVRAIMTQATDSGSHDPEAWGQVARSMGLDPYQATPAEITAAHAN